MIAVLMSGASFVPIEPDFPLQYIQYIIADSNTEVIIADKYTPKLQEVVCKTHLYLNTVFSQSHLNVYTDYRTSPDNEAAILYTSGTTGKPKGVRLTHLGLTNVLESVMKSIDLSNSEISNDYVLHSSSTTFDSFFLETFPPLWTGGTIIVHPTNPLKETRCSGLLRYVNFLHTQPVKLSFFKPSSFMSLNRLTFGGEAPTMNLLQPWLEVCDNSWNIYGPTETSVITTAAHITNSIHLGKCIQNAQLKILTPSMQIAPQGVSGELHVGGFGVALGYTNLTQTKKMFWKDEKSNNTFYRTGDLVYLDHNKVLNFIGRLPKDRQVKVGGVRIELSGIEHVIQQQHGVKFVRVIKEERTNRNDILVAYVCPETVNCKIIQSYLRKILPVQTIPTLIVPVRDKEIQFSSSGKLQWKTMKYKKYTRSASVKLCPPSTETERLVLNLYCQCLGLEHCEVFGLDNKIMEFGGDSVTILHLVGKLRSKLKWDVIPSDIVDYTPSELILKYQQHKFHLSMTSNESNMTDSNQKNEIISGNQEALLSMDHIALGPTYNIPYTFKISGNKTSCACLTFALDRVLQVIASTLCDKTSPLCTEVIHVDLSEFSIEKSQKDAIQLSRKNALLLIDPKKAPYRCILYYVGKGCYVLSLVIHHISFDYTSWYLIQQMFEESYKLSSTDDIPTLTNHTSSVNVGEHLQFWKQEMKDCSLTVRLPTTYEKRGARPFVGKRLEFKLDDALIVKLCHGIKVDPSVFFLSVYGILIHWISKKSSFGIGVSVNQRQTVNLKRTVGFLTNTIICKFPADVLQGRYFDLLHYVQNWQEKAIYHSAVSIFDIINYSQHKLGAQKYLPQLLYNFISDYAEPSLSLGKGIFCEFVDLPTRTSKAELVLDVSHDGQYYKIVWEYCTSLFSDAYINDWNDCFLTLLNCITTGVHKSICTCELKIPSNLHLSTCETQAYATSTVTCREKIESLQLSYYQNKLLHESLQTLDNLSGGLVALATLSLDQELSSGAVEDAVQMLLSKSKFLASCLQIIDGTGFLIEATNLHVGVTHEVVSENDELTVKIREQLWPFDLFSGPLLRFTLVHNVASNKKYLIISTHQVLLNECSLILLCNQLKSLLKLKKDNTTCEYRPPLYCIPQEHEKVTEFWLNYMAKYDRPIPLSPEYSYCSPCVTYKTFSKEMSIIFENQDDLVIHCCMFASILLWNLQKTSIIQFCFLINNSVCSHFCASEEIYPVAIDVDLSKAESLKQLHSSIINYLKCVSKHEPPNYWKLQEQISSYTSFVNPYHDVFLQVSDKSQSDSKYVNEDDLIFPRPFKIQLYFNASKQKITLKTMLNSQQTTAVQKCFTECIALVSKGSLSGLKSADYQVSSKPSSCLIGSISRVFDCEPLSATLEKVLQSHPNSVLYTDIARGACASTINVPCLVTVKEFYNQVKLISYQLRAIMKDAISVKVAIVTKGGYEMPISIVAALLCKCTFLISQSTDEQELIKKLKQVEVSLVLYDRFRISTVEKMASKMPHLNFMFVSTFNEHLKQEVADLEAVDIDRPLHFSSCAFIVFTSGSTGLPKVIQVSEKSLRNFLFWHTERFASCDNATLNWLQHVHPHFDAVIAEVIGQLLLKNNLVLINPTNRLNNSYVTTVLKRYHINCIHTTPTILSQFLHGKNLRNITWNYKTLPELQHVFSGGERVSRDHYNTFLQRFPPNMVSFHNWGGPAEACIGYAHCEFNDLPSFSSLPMGTIIANTILDVFSVSSQLPLPRGMIGEIAISGLPICEEFLRTSEVYSDSSKRLWYLTGDIGYINTQNKVVLLKRKDKQIKLNSERVDIDSVRGMIMKLKISEVLDIIVDVYSGMKNEVVCFPIVSSESVTEKSLQEQLMFMLPKKFVPRVVKCFLVDQVPKLTTGKLDHKRLQEIASLPKVTSLTSSTRSLSKLTDVLLECIGSVLPYTTQIDYSLLIYMSLDSLGMNSLHKAQFHQLVLRKNIDIKMSSILLSKNLHELAQNIAGDSENINLPLKACDIITESKKVAIIAVEINVPGAKTCDEFWNIIADNRDTITHDLPNLIEPGEKTYVGSRGLIDGTEYFDAHLFNIHSEEARYMDPQQRLLLQAVWTCMEKAGYNPIQFSKFGKIGCFASTHFPQYLLHCMSSLPQSSTSNVVWGNLRDNVALRIGRYLDFRGPCVSFANNCASQAVALHHARISLLRKECDIAVVAAATVSAKRTGYIYRKLDIYSPDGHCSPFSAAANGTVMSDGLTVLVLRRLSDARDDNDDILCIVNNTAIGSDGALASTKSYAPAVKGQVETLTKALAHAPPSTIKLIEAHGTGTPIGDEIEIEAFKLAFKDVKQPIVLGSVKGNIGHLGVASAGAGIVKAALALQKRKFPPNNGQGLPTIGLQKSIFNCLKTTREWTHSSSHTPRRALVQSIGVLGVNSAIVLEEDVDIALKNKQRKIPAYVPFCISAKTEWSLRSLYRRIAEYTSKFSNIPLIDIAYTLCYGRKNLPIRFAKVITHPKQLNDSPQSGDISFVQSCTNHICIAFTGQGTLVSIQAFRAYSECIPEFKESVSKFCVILESSYPKHFPAGLTNILTKSEDHYIDTDFQKPIFQHALTVVFQLSVFNALQKLGVDVNIVMGHSLGEYTAACVAGFLSEKDLLYLICERALLLEKEAPEGLMLSVNLCGEKCQAEYLCHFPSLEVACFNSSQCCVVSGPMQDIEKLHTTLKNNNIHSNILETMHIAYHHSSLRGIEIPFVKCCEQSSKQMITTLKTSDYTLLPVISELNDKYWRTHLTTPIDFPQALTSLMKCCDTTHARVIEIGMVEYLKVYASHMNQSLNQSWCSLVGSNNPEEIVYFLSEVWKTGISVELFRLPLFTGASKCHLPTYVFDVQKYWVDELVQTQHVGSKSDTIRVSIESELQADKTTEVVPTRDNILSLIRTIAGPGYEQNLPSDSLTLTHIRNRVIHAFNVDIVELLMKKVCPEAIADHIIANCSERHKNIIMPAQSECIKHENPIIELSIPDTSVVNKPNLFIVYAVGGELFSFQPLAALLSQSYQVFGIHSALALQLFTTVEDVAKFYCSKIESIQSHGPFIIGGYSVGSWIAHSIVRQLEESGNIVSMLFMIDPLALDSLKPTTAEFAFERAIVLSDVYVKYFLNNPNKKLMEDMIQQFKKQVNELIVYRSTLQIVKCDVWVLLARERLLIDGQHLKQSSHWRAISSGSVEVVEIPGSHSNCISSVNCFHIAASIPFKNIALDHHIPPSSTAEIVGNWRLKSITSTSVTTLSSQQYRQTKLVFKDDGDYFCMVPKSVLSNLSDKLTPLLNSSGRFIIRENKTGNAVFMIDTSFEMSIERVHACLTASAGRMCMKYNDVLFMWILDS